MNGCEQDNSVIQMFFLKGSLWLLSEERILGRKIRMETQTAEYGRAV